MHKKNRPESGAVISKNYKYFIFHLPKKDNDNPQEVQTFL